MIVANQGRWIRFKDRFPDENDADYAGQVFCLDETGRVELRMVRELYNLSLEDVRDPMPPEAKVIETILLSSVNQIFETGCWCKTGLPKKLVIPDNTLPV